MGSLLCSVVEQAFSIQIQIVVMKFIVDYNDYCGFKQVIYRKDEHSLDTIPWLHEIDFDIALNTLTLTVIDSKVVQLNGFCGLANAQRLTCTPPANQKGVIKVVDSESYAWDAVCVSLRFGTALYKIMKYVK